MGKLLKCLYFEFNFSVETLKSGLFHLKYWNILNSYDKYDKSNELHSNRNELHSNFKLKKQNNKRIS